MHIHEITMNDCVVEIPFSHHPYSNCVQDIFVAYLKWKRENYKNLFDDTWTFCFHEESDYLNIDIYRNGFSQLYRSLYLQFGIELEFMFSFEDIKPILNRIRQEFLNNNVIGVCVDPFYCNWTKEYQNKHNIHFILLSGIKENHFVCCDPYVDPNVQLFPIDMFFIAAKNIFFFKYKKNIKICRKERMLKTIEAILEDKNKRNDFQQMRKFSAILKYTARIRDELKLYENIVMYPLLLQLNNIGFGRKCFAEYLEEMCRYYPDLYIFDIISSLNKIAETWSRFGLKVVKYKKSGYKDSAIYQLADDIYSVSIAEEECALNLKERLF